MPTQLNPTTPEIYVLGDNAKGIEIDWSTNGNVTGCTIAGSLIDLSTGRAVPGWTGSIMTTGASIAQANSPCRLQWTWPQPFSPTLPIGLYKFEFVITFADGRTQHTDWVEIQVVAS